MAGILFLVQFNNFNRTMSFYWSYTSCPFLCALARRNGARQAKSRKHELTSLLLATNSLSPVTVRYFFVHLWLPWWCEQHGNWKRKTQKWNCKTKPLLLILHGWPQRDSVCMLTNNNKRRGYLIRESEAIPLRYHTRSLSVTYTLGFTFCVACTSCMASYSPWINNLNNLYPLSFHSNY